MMDVRRPAVFAWKAARWMLRWAKHGFALVGALVLVYCCAFDYARIAPNPTLATTTPKQETYDGVLSERFAYRFRSPRRWEVIIFRNAEGSPAMKRVVGLPGEKVQMRSDGRIVIDGQEIVPPKELAFLHYFPYGNLVADLSVACGDGYYVLGDALRDIDDGRFNGPIGRDKIIGRAWMILRPETRRGLVR